MVAAAIPAHAKDRPIEIWFQDEARVGQQGTLTRLWAKRGSRPPALRDRRFDWAYIFGAACPATGATAAFVTPKANAAMFQLHLDEIACNVAPGSHALIVLDGAGWHGARELKIPDNLTLLALPPYSPELNPIENVWQYLRQNFLSNRVFDDYDAIVEACCQAWRAFIALPDVVRSVTTRAWATVKI